jgi:hypothetical protein
VLAFSGDQYTTLLSFGGTDGSPESDFSAQWLPTTTFWTTDRSVLVPDSIPEARFGHTLTFNLFGSGDWASSRVAVLYGGKGASAFYDSIWVMTRLSSDTTWKWTRRKPTDDPNHSPGNPGKRYLHTMTLASDDSLYVYGGIDDSGNTLSDVWKLSLTGSESATSWHWKYLTSGGGPGARAGHTAVFDADHSRILVFGGITDASGTLADSAVYAFSTLSPGWSTPSLNGSGPRPGPRQGHVMVADNYERRSHSGYDNQYRAVMWGGRTDALVSDRPWFLWYGPASQSWVEWEHADTVNTAPSSRANCGGYFDPDWRRLTLFGGDSVLTPAARSNQTWALSFAEGGNKWQHLVPKAGSPAPRALSGSAIVIDRRDVQARIPEKFGLHDGSGADTTAWTVINAPLQQDDYPFMFEMPDGRILDAGPRQENVGEGVINRLNLATASWNSLTITDDAFRSQSKMGSAVMYRPGRVLRCGSRNPDDGGVGSNATDTLEYQCAVSPCDTLKGWRLIANQLTGQMARRDEPNLTMLPTGQVLVTGGMNHNREERQPQIWSPGTVAWGDSLALDPGKRNYHSAAILLPDGRVLSTGGQDDLEVSIKDSLTIYEPPYLFDHNDSLITTGRPVVSGEPLDINYGKVFTICTDQAATIRSACLIRPGAVTHAYNQDQRFVPLSISKATSPARLFATAPASAYLAPPGDYLLFVLDSTAVADSVPSVARWVNVNATGGLDLCDSVLPDSTDDLVADCNPDVTNGWILSWTAPGDDKSIVESGPASAFDMRKSSNHITNWNFSSATGMTAPTPGPAGTQQTLNTSTSSNKYIRLRTKDDNLQQSGLSDEVLIFPWSSQNIDCGGGDGMMGGGGGGGGYSAGRSPGFTSAQATETQTYLENSMLAGVRPGVRGTDFLRVAGSLSSAIENYTARIREVKGRAAALDQVRLLAVDHASELATYRVANDFVLGIRHEAIGVHASDGTNLSPELSGAGHVGAPGETLSVDLGQANGASPLVLEADGTYPSAIDVLVPDGAGGWRSTGIGSPRRVSGELVFPPPGSDAIRLAILGRVSLYFAGSLELSAKIPVVHVATLAAAKDARLGDVAAVVDSSDGTSASIVGPDTLTLAFSTPPLEEGSVRDLFLAVDATPLSPKTLAQYQRAELQTQLPTRFALRQNQPNPFSVTTTLRFDLPVGSMVRLEVFDAQGRKVATLANRFFPAGSHAVGWNPSAGGSRVGPGIYFYRIEAGSFRDRKKMALIQ